ARAAARWPWITALVAGAALPAVSPWRPDGVRRLPSAGGSLWEALAALLERTGTVAPVATLHVAPRVAAEPSTAAVGFDRTLGLAWGVLAACALVRLALRAVATSHATAAEAAAPGARLTTTGRARVLVTSSLGPAVLGGWRATVVLPRWAGEQLDGPARRLIFEHEAEHVRAGDPRLLTAAAVLVALVPWNPVGWWTLARLRVAVELDCDRRVLARAGVRGGSVAPAPVASYGSLLLAVAARHAASASTRVRLAPALAESHHTTLERRIRQMTAPRPSAARARLALLTLGTTASAVVACEMPRPTGPGAVTRLPVSSVAPGSASPVTRELTLADVRRAVDPRTLADMQAPLGRTRTLVVIDSAGRVIDAAAGVRGGATTRRFVLRPGVRATVQLRDFAPGALAPDSASVSWIHANRSDVAAARGSVTIAARAATVSGEGKSVPDSTLIVVNGRVVGRGMKFAQSVISPDAIQSIDVLKGALAIARYGDAGRAGVIVLTTKNAAGG
ncbi:MAG TPA: M56 family metallopeptidase, partial [Gemmatirosa sp.]